MPTVPKELQATLLRRLTDRSGGTSEVRAIVVLSNLLGTVPAPPKVRAAAFRALAALPGIENLGRSAGGYVLRLPNEDGAVRLVIDPKTAKVTTQWFSQSLGGGRQPVTIVTMSGEWTDRLPPLSGRGATKQKDYGVGCRWGRQGPRRAP